jgi:hypothetical protein
VESPLRRLGGIALVLVAGLVAVGLYHDWLSWNSARWGLGWRFVLEKHIAPQEIEGGFEWNGWYATMDPNQPLSPPDYSRGQEKGGSLAMPFTRVYFPAVTGRYALVYTPPPHTVVLESQAYSQWMLLGEREFVLVEAQP